MLKCSLFIFGLLLCSCNVGYVYMRSLTDVHLHESGVKHQSLAAKNHSHHPQDQRKNFTFKTNNFFASTKNKNPNTARILIQSHAAVTNMFGWSAEERTTSSISNRNSPRHHGTRSSEILFKFPNLTLQSELHIGTTSKPFAAKPNLHPFITTKKGSAEIANNQKEHYTNNDNRDIWTIWSKPSKIDNKSKLTPNSHKIRSIENKHKKQYPQFFNKSDDNIDSEYNIGSNYEDYYIEDDVQLADTDEDLNDYYLENYPNDEESLTAEKFRTLGTPDAVDRSRRLTLNRSNMEIQTHQAVVHMQRIPSCRLPQPRIIHFADPEPNRARTFTPHCTELYRCGDDTGCCGSLDLTCVARRSELVELPFYVFFEDTGFRFVQNRTFSNDTECYCISRIDIKQIDSTLVKEDTPECVCPSDFDSVAVDTKARDRTSIDEPCMCQCRRQKMSICSALLEGRDRFSVADTNCITQGECVIPKCVHGSFNPTTGRCTSREQKLILLQGQTLEPRQVFGNRHRQPRQPE